MIRGFCLAMLVAVCICCELPLNEENFVGLSEEPTTRVEIQLGLLGDTLKLIRPTTLVYNLDLTGNAQFLVKAYVGTQLVHESKATNGSFELSPFRFEDGLYPFEFKVYASSGTKSLAEKLGFENLLFEQKRVVWVEKAPPQKIEITSLQPVDGNIRVTWERYPRINFERYTLYRNVLSDNGSYTWGEIFSIGDRNQTTFVDPSYIGGRATYYISTQVVGHTNMIPSTLIQYSVPRPSIQTFETKARQLHLRWTRPLLPKAFQKYIVKDLNEMNSAYFQSNRLEDTTCVIQEFGFGREQTVELRTLPVGAFDSFGPSTETHGVNKQVFLGQPFPVHQEIFINTSANRVYYYQNGYLFVCLNHQNQPYDSAAIDLNQNFDNRYAVGFSSNGQFLYVGSREFLLQLDPISLDPLQSLHLPSVLGKPEARPYRLLIGDQNLLAIDTKTPEPFHEIGFTSRFVSIVDGNMGTVKDTLHVIADITAFDADSQLKYLYAVSDKRRVIKLNEQGLDVQREELPGPWGRGFFDNNSLFIFSTTRRDRIDLTTFTQTEVTPLAEWMPSSRIDWSGNLMDIVSGNYFVTLDARTFQEKSRVKLYQNAGLDRADFHLGNGRLYSKRGYVLNLE